MSSSQAPRAISKLRSRAALALGIGLLLAQVAMIVVARFHPARYYCWAPFDALNEYRITATVDGHALDALEIARRYRIPAVGLDPRSIQHVFDVVEHVERRYERDRPARVEVVYRTNGGPERRWTFVP